MISFIIPAHNEQACLGPTLHAIHNSAATLTDAYEIIVVDDASTDRTAEIARDNGATVVQVSHRQIAATRNSGARAAAGERFFFVDADTTINARVVAAAMSAMDKGAAGGAALPRFDADVPLYSQLLVWWLGVIMRFVGVAGGACMFCTREAFQSTGGFDETLFGAEDAAMCWALKRHGPFRVLWPKVETSGRRMRGIHGFRMVAILVRMAFFPGLLKQREAVQSVWYESNREHDQAVRDSLRVRAMNLVMLVLLVLIVTSPVWSFIPESLTPPGSMRANIRLGIGVFCCHVGLLLWPCAYFLIRALPRQTRWIERIKILALLAVCLWFAWDSTRAVLWFWPWLLNTWLFAAEA